MAGGQGRARQQHGGAQKALVLQILRPRIWAQDPSPVPLCAHLPLSDCAPQGRVFAQPRHCLQPGVRFRR